MFQMKVFEKNETCFMHNTLFGKCYGFEIIKQRGNECTSIQFESLAHSSQVQLHAENFGSPRLLS